uniref:Putative secreted protein n=1 Tax=Xenopsylla cheopis TaxID=163159 RepID=A0A6M2DYG7_XENCH
MTLMIYLSLVLTVPISVSVATNIFATHQCFEGTSKICIRRTCIAALSKAAVKPLCPGINAISIVMIGMHTTCLHDTHDRATCKAVIIYTINNASAINTQCK